MGFVSEFKAFALRGNVIDLAVGVIIGGAFGKITGSLVSDVIMPPIGLLIGGQNFTAIKIMLKDAIVGADGKVISEAVTLNIGSFMQVVFDFAILAFAIFLMVKGINSLKENFEKEKAAEQAVAPPAPPELTKEEALLTEIRDLLKK